jgi:hypothetical protein
VSEAIATPTGPETLKSKPKLALNPRHPERICWGCDKYCSADDLRCGNGTIRTQHPVELFGEDWHECELEEEAQSFVEGEQEIGTSEAMPKQ